MTQRDYEVPALRKAIALIELLCASSRPMGISEISQALDLNKNMVFRMVRTLTQAGWLCADNEENLKYRMTLAPFQHTSKPVQRMNFRMAALEPLRILWEKTQQSCYLCILDRRRSLCIEHMDATGVLRIHGAVGGHYYLHATAPGKIFLAYDTSNLLDRLNDDDLPRLTPNTLTDKPLLADHLHQVMAQGYAVDDRENAEGVLCYAVPVFNYQQQVVGAIGLSTLTFEYTTRRMIDELGPLVDEAGRTASRILGAAEKIG